MRSRSCRCVEKRCNCAGRVGNVRPDNGDLQTTGVLVAYLKGSLLLSLIVVTLFANKRRCLSEYNVMGLRLSFDRVKVAGNPAHYDSTKIRICCRQHASLGICTPSAYNAS